MLTLYLSYLCYVTGAALDQTEKKHIKSQHRVTDVNLKAQPDA